MQHISALLKAQAELRPGAPALTAPGRADLTYASLFQFVSEASSRLLEAGISPGHRIALVLPGGPETATAFLLASCAAVAAPLNPALHQSDYEFYLADLEARVLVTSDPAHPAARAAARLSIPVLVLEPLPCEPAGLFRLFGLDRIRAGRGSPSDGSNLALLLHTSGTTARPKLVPLTHRNLLASARNVALSVGLSSADRCLNVMPLFHVHGLVGSLLASLWAGGSVVCQAAFQAPLFLDWLAEFQATWYTTVPAIHHAVLGRSWREGSPPQLPHLRFIRSCSAPLDPQLMQKLEDTFAVPVIEAYGMTEAAHQIASNPLPPRTRKSGSVGLPTGVEVAIVGEDGQFLPSDCQGEIVIRGENVTPGYLNNPEANQSSFFDGWFRTGDLGLLDRDGYLRICGRLKEMINRAGEKIAPREIDEVLMRHPGVAEAIAFAIPHPQLGENVGAAVVLQPAAQLSPLELKRFAASRLPHFKVPSRIYFVDAIPKGPTGKPQRSELARQLGAWEPHGAAGGQRELLRQEARASVESVLAEIWRQLLRLDSVAPEDNFFELGGDSILLAQVVAQVCERLRVELRIVDLLDAPTLEAQADVIHQLLVERQ